MISLRHTIVGSGRFQLSVESLDLPVGMTLLVGRNGAGKSTLLRLLATAIPPDGGSIEYAGRRVSTDLPLIRRNIGYLPTGLELYEEMSPRKLLRYMCSLKGIEEPGEPELWLEKLRFGGNPDHPIRTLSQGQKQLIGIAQACLGSPPFLLLDEPLGGLDRWEQKQVIHELALLSQRSVVVVATHELNDWSHAADRLLWLDEGVVRFYGSARMWVSGLKSKVWSGTLPAAALAGLDEERLLFCRVHEERQEAEIRWIGEPPPDGIGSEAEMTLEDAYFIRRYALSRLGRG
ncbi:ATP-binding cassette domain-containing protein [Paenibacillus ginsengihumi]|uniref:ATP-binding cassette domain-containing protein n=1 Tax=Paenibacillus ginsengihumi TaxID=431596 RepID=UPI00037BA74F|nr:ABC transporter ATP-binding protein [Paenibacillus ginsengihumi]